jgi:hypothetical protein
MEGCAVTPMPDLADILQTVRPVTRLRGQTRKPSSLETTAQSGTDAYQRVPFTAAYSEIGPGTFYILAQFNNTSARFNTHTLGNFGASKKTGETFDTFTTITPPTTFTTALGPISTETGCSLWTTSSSSIWLAAFTA